MISRRSFLRTTGLVLGAGALPASAKVLAPQKTVLLQCAWATKNIGDIGHTPGTLRFLEQSLPEAKQPDAGDSGRGRLRGWPAGEEIRLVPIDSERLTAKPISTMINNVKNQGPQCVDHETKVSITSCLLSVCRTARTRRRRPQRSSRTPWSLRQRFQLAK